MDPRLAYKLIPALLLPLTFIVLLDKTVRRKVSQRHVATLVHESFHSLSLLQSRRKSSQSICHYSVYDFATALPSIIRPQRWSSVDDDFIHFLALIHRSCIFPECQNLNNKEGSTRMHLCSSLPAFSNDFLLLLNVD